MPIKKSVKQGKDHELKQGKAQKLKSVLELVNYPSLLSDEARKGISRLRVKS